MHNMILNYKALGFTFKTRDFYKAGVKKHAPKDETTNIPKSKRKNKNV